MAAGMGNARLWAWQKKGCGGKWAAGTEGIRLREWKAGYKLRSQAVGTRG